MAHKYLAQALRKTIFLLGSDKGAKLLLQDESACISDQIPGML
jgi:hypothetical protein